MSAAVLEHRQIVQRLYLAALRTARDYSYSWDAKRRLQLGIRAQFDKHRHDESRKDWLVVCAKTMLNLHAHHEPYIPINSVDSITYDRHYIIPKKIRENGYDDFKGVL